MIDKTKNRALLAVVKMILIYFSMHLLALGGWHWSVSSWKIHRSLDCFWGITIPCKISLHWWSPIRQVVWIFFTLRWRILFIQCPEYINNKIHIQKLYEVYLPQNRQRTGILSLFPCSIWNIAKLNVNGKLWNVTCLHFDLNVCKKDLWD